MSRQLELSWPPLLLFPFIGSIHPQSTPQALPGSNIAAEKTLLLCSLPAPSYSQTYNMSSYSKLGLADAFPRPLDCISSSTVAQNAPSNHQLSSWRLDHQLNDIRGLASLSYESTLCKEYGTKGHLELVCKVQKTIMCILTAEFLWNPIALHPIPDLRSADYWPARELAAWSPHPSFNHLWSRSRYPAGL